MWPDRVSNPGPLTYESGALPPELRGPAIKIVNNDIPLTVQGIPEIMFGKFSI